jgi:hypothetical protein
VPRARASPDASESPRRITASSMAQAGRSVESDGEEGGGGDERDVDSRTNDPRRSSLLLGGGREEGAREAFAYSAIPSLSESRASPISREFSPQVEGSARWARGRGRGRGGTGEEGSAGEEDREEDEEALLDPQGGQQFVLGDFRVTSPRIGGKTIASTPSPDPRRDREWKSFGAKRADSLDPDKEGGRAATRGNKGEEAAGTRRTRSVERSQPFTIYLSDEAAEQRLGPTPRHTPRAHLAVR